MKRFAVVMALLVGGTAYAESIDDQITLGWRELGPHELGWTPGRTPLLPSVFPIVKGTPLVTYAYARRSGVVADGENVAAPWAEVSIAPDGEITRKMLQHALHVVGIQGVHPVMASSLPTPQERHDANAWIIRQTGGQAPPAVRKVYCQWASGNSVIAGVLPSSARAFIVSLRCDAK